ncbi:MAG TPA: hypothetical protein ENK11_02720, partial [Phycisphaerales bacterium]|nr:hypothetical protein [Phycisphaerales bacterium]
MATNRDRSVACLIASCALFTQSMPALAGVSGGVGGAEAAAASSVQALDTSGVIDRIGELIVADKLVRAQAMINELVSGDAALGLSDDESRRVFGLLREVNRKIRRADPLEISLQRAELALVRDDLVSSTQQAEAVRSSASADEGQRARAEMLLSMIEQKRDALRRVLESRISRAIDAFDRGDYAAAKSGLLLIDRSGLALDDAQRLAVSSRLARIRSIENERGGSYDGGVALLSMMEPGVADKTGWNDRKQPAAAEPAPATAQQHASPVPASAPSEDMIAKARRLEAQSVLAEADRAWAEAKYADAQRLYTQAVELGRGFLSDDQIALAESRLTESAVILRGNLPSGAPLEDDINVRSVARQQTEAEFANAMEQAREAMKTGDMGKARDAASTAKLTLNQGRDLFDIATYESMLSQADDLLAEINDAEERQRILRNEQIQKEAAAKAARERASKAREVDQKIAELIESVRAHQAEQNYEKALQEV